jgi:hypothetical protein
MSTSAGDMRDVINFPSWIDYSAARRTNRVAGPSPVEA